jgi:hypothetical protein
MSHEIVVKDGTIVDGTGAEPFTAHLAIDEERISAIGKNLGEGREVVIRSDGCDLQCDRDCGAGCSTTSIDQPTRDIRATAPLG